MAIDIGLIAYNAYRKSIQENSITDFVHAPWIELGKLSQDAWRHSAVAVSQYLSKCKEDMNNKPNKYEQMEIIKKL